MCLIVAREPEQSNIAIIATFLPCNGNHFSSSGGCLYIVGT